MISRLFVACAALSATLLSSSAFAADPATCAKPRFSDVGWTDITATTEIARQLLDGLGYKPEVSVLSVAITFKALENGDRDVFLGNWMPLQEPTQVPLVKAGKIDIVATNLEGARIGFATSKAAYDAGLKTYADIATFKDKLGGKIYGIEAGSGANNTITRMIADNTFGLKGFDLVESSEQGMLAQVTQKIRQKEPVVFFGWRPHPMNVNMPITYLADGNDVFGPHDGGATVVTLSRPGYVKDCPNVGKLLTNLVFDVAMEDQLMSDILDKGQTADVAVRTWLKANPAAVERWLAGVTTLDGKPGTAAVKSGLGL
ncbi:glycine betaine/proline transport system substrate-binding protein [Angulomicrobium tetraedrale]|uniref:Glycine betaine/proline transport system substrate-binding protein n=1 Tax=Ancylobacter tetraedralis TaxID=217068 RepID=A0A839ZGF9_9HYPH|nr:choline ABC transporter substrate-binding protein [Ancylobacter tetraedralis]MBB3773706.1 glycine betaine/proline transport system substrate-binding protein [Ancylobacter tetraedralis]